MTLFFNKKNILILFLTLFAFISCNNDDDSNSSFEIEPENEVKNFVWQSMNSWYNWQEDVTDLADSKDDDEDSYNTYLSRFDSPEDLFNNLKYSEEDDFSWFIDDYVAQQQAFQGVTTTFGINISPPILVEGEGTDYVIYFIEDISIGSPAEVAGFQRGDIINGFNGTIMTLDNYYETIVNAYFEDTTEFNFAENDGITFKESKTITQAIVEDNPIKLTKVFEDIAGKKVGYILYNGFRSSYNDELNTAFGELKSAGIDELILDLRYNGGGSVLTSAFLASMIYDGAGEETVFGALLYNSKHTDSNASVPFFDELYVYDDDGEYTGVDQTINRLSGINELYVLTSNSTASASEMIINGLRPFIDVKIIGDTTTGKNEGSITLYDSPGSDYTDVDTANSSHTMAMQPIVFQIYNNLGQSDYTSGFEPDILVEEWRYWDTILPFGDENEIVLKTALDDIRGLSAKSIFKATNSQKIEKSFSTHKFEKEMYLDSNFFQ